MLFGPDKGPQLFITFIHDLDSSLEALADFKGLTINDVNTNTKMIVDDILSWTRVPSTALLYTECQLRV